MLVPTPSTNVCSQQGRRRKVAILGSTGSIGRSALELLSKHTEQFEIFALVAGSSEQVLHEQASRFKPRYAVLAHGACFSSERIPAVEFLVGAKAAQEIAAHPEVDLVLASVVGMAGLPAVLSAVAAGKTIALANKESLVCAGELVAKLQAQSGAKIIPVDSEHSAIFQALQGERLSDLEELILTASGGPFLNTPIEKFSTVSVEQALRHPRWNMGPKISIDSATLVNKGLELIEACFLFGVSAQQIKVLVHPQSIVHSLVAFRDGTQIAQLSVTDMQGPIAFALNYPNGRLGQVLPKLDLAQLGRLDFHPLDSQKFPAVELARQAMLCGGAMPAVYNLANENAVAGFISGRITFDRIVKVVENALSRFSGRKYTDLEQLVALADEIKETLSL